MKEKFKFLKDFSKKYKELEPEKKRVITICSIIVIALVIITIVSIIISSQASKADKIIGNLNNTGFVTEKGNKVYISNTVIGAPSEENRGIYQIDKKGNAKLVNSDQYVKSLTEYKGQLYYIAVNAQDNGNYIKQIVKMKPDGSNKKIVVDGIENTTIDDSAMNISDGWIYYLNSDYKIEKVKVNGEKRQQISDEEIDYFQIDGQYIYYLTKDSEFKRMKKNGNSVEELEKGIGTFQVISNNVYYISRANDHLMRLNIKDKSDTEIVSKKVKTFNICKGTLYYATKEDEDKAIYKAKVDGSNEKKIVDIGSENIYICVVDDWIYYTDKVEDNYYEYNLYKVKINGNDKQTLNI